MSPGTPFTFTIRLVGVLSWLCSFVCFVCLFVCLFVCFCFPAQQIRGVIRGVTLSGPPIITEVFSPTPRYTCLRILSPIGSSIPAALRCQSNFCDLRSRALSYAIAMLMHYWTAVVPDSCIIRLLPKQAEGNEQRLSPAFLELERQKALYHNLEVREIRLQNAGVYLLLQYTPAVRSNISSKLIFASRV